MKGCWPNFFIVGAPRAGTTSLYEYLRQHPQIFMSPIKEPGYFSPLIHTSPFCDVWNPKPITREDEYLKLFSAAKYYLAIGEATPSYLFDPQSAYLISQKVPNAKIIVILRDPVEQVLSHYFKIALTVSLPSLYHTLNTRDWGWYLLESARYGTHLRRYFDIFGRDRVLVLLYSDLKKNPSNIVKRVCDFLGVNDNIECVRIKKYNPTVAPRNRISYKIIMLRRRGVARKFPIPYVLKKVLNNVLFLGEGEKPDLDEKTLILLARELKQEMVEVEKLLGCNLPELHKSLEKYG